MFELLTAIALLCQINPGVPAIKPVEKVQLSCQKYYIRCVKDSPGILNIRLQNCIYINQ